MDTVQHFRRRAEALRAIAEGVTEKIERQKLLEIAEEYERWAREREASIAERNPT